MPDKLYRITRTSTIGPEYLIAIVMPDGRTYAKDIDPSAIRKTMRLLRGKGYIRIGSIIRERD